MVLMMKNIKNWCSHVPFKWSDIILAQWWCPVASSEALDLLHQGMHAVTYQRIAMAIKMVSLFSTFFLVCCCPGGCWGDTEHVVARWRRPVASGEALDKLHWAVT
jgi:hypothetical protein